MYRFILLLIAFFLSIPLFSEENKLDLTFISIQSESVNISGISYPIFIYTDPQKQYKTIDKVIYDKEDGEISYSFHSRTTSETFKKLFQFYKGNPILGVNIFENVKKYKKNEESTDKKPIIMYSSKNCTNNKKKQIIMNTSVTAIYNDKKKLIPYKWLGNISVNIRVQEGCK